MGIEQQIGIEKRPLRLDMLKFSQLMRFIIEPGCIFENTLVPIQQKTFTAISAAQFFYDLSASLFHHFCIFNRIGWIADDTQKRRIGLFGDRLSGQKALECEPCPCDVALYDMDHCCVTGDIAKEVETVHRLECRFGHADRAAVDLGSPFVNLVATLPDAVVGRTVTAADVVDEILDEVDLIHRIDDAQSRSGHLGKHEQKDRCRIDLEVAPLIISNDGKACAGTVLGMQCVDRFERIFEPLHTIRLTHHSTQKPSHQFDNTLGKQMCPVVLSEMTLVRQRKSPDTQDAVDIVPDPGIGIVAVRIDRGGGGKQSGDRVLTGEDNLLNRPVVPVESGLE